MESCTIEIRAAGTGRLLVSLTAPDGAEESAEVALPFPAGDLGRRAAIVAALRRGTDDRQVAPDDLAAALPAASDALREAEALGGQLFDLLLPPTLRPLYLASRHAGREGVRLLLDIQVPELAPWPWELLFDREQGEFTALDRRSPVVRYLAVGRPRDPLRVEPPLRVLVMTAQPRDQARLNVAGEEDRLRRAMAPLVASGTVELQPVPGSTWRHLLDATAVGGQHVFHFIGHGRAGHLALAGDDGATDLRSARDMGLLLGDLPDLRLAFLNACEGALDDPGDPFGSVAATLVERGVPAAVAMQNPISDAAAVELARAFYEALARGQPVDVALTAGRKAVLLASRDSLEWATPVLTMRSPDGVLFAPPPMVAVDPRVDGWRAELAAAETRGDWEAATEVGEELLAVTDDDVLRQRVAAAHLARATAALAANDAAAARADLNRAVELAPGDPAVYAERARANLALDRITAAMDDLTVAIDLDGQQAELYYLRGRANHQAAFHRSAAGGYAAAIADFSRAMDLDPAQPKHAYGRGRSYLQAAQAGDPAGDYQRAVDDFSRVIDAAPADADAYLWRGRAQKALGRGSAAEADFQQAVLLGSDEARSELGWWQRILGSWRRRGRG